MPKNVLVIDGHPDKHDGRLCHALADAYRTGCKAGGHEVRLIKISDRQFHLIRTQEEFENGQVPADILEAQDAMRWCDHLMIIYPLWLGTMPALLKAFFEQTFRPGFAFDPEAKGWPQGRLKGRSARIVVTMGMPGLVYRWYFGAHSLKSLERNVLQFAGFRPVRDTIFGMVDTADHARSILAMKDLGRRAI